MTVMRRDFAKSKRAAAFGRRPFNFTYKKCYNKFAMEPILKTEKEYLNLFKISIFVKGISAIGEILAGIFLWFANKAFLVTYFLNFFQNDLSDNPRDHVANFIVNSAASFAVSSQYVLSSYLFLRGLIKLFLIINLFRKKLWAYPASIVVFLAFIVYELYQFYEFGSPLVLAFALLDALIVLLAGHEYGVLRKRMRNKK